MSALVINKLRKSTTGLTPAGLCSYWHSVKNTCLLENQLNFGGEPSFLADSGLAQCKVALYPGRKLHTYYGIVAKPFPCCLRSNGTTAYAAMELLPKDFKRFLAIAPELLRPLESAIHSQLSYILAVTGQNPPGGVIWDFFTPWMPWMGLAGEKLIRT